MIELFLLKIPILPSKLVGSKDGTTPFTHIHVLGHPCDIVASPAFLISHRSHFLP